MDETYLQHNFSFYCKTLPEFVDIFLESRVRKPFVERMLSIGGLLLVQMNPSGDNLEFMSRGNYLSVTFDIHKKQIVHTEVIMRCTGLQT